MRMDTLQVAKHVEIQRDRFNAFRPTLAQAGEIVVGGGKNAAGDLKRGYKWLPP
jgi:hypothetical protein